MKLFPLSLAPLGLVLFLACLPAAASADEDISLDKGAVWQTKDAGQDTQGFLQIHNTGNAPDLLTGWSCTIAASTALVGADGKALDSLLIPPGQTMTLSAAGPHLVLTNVRYKVEFGSILPCAFTFQQSGDLIGYLNAIPAPKK